MVDSLKIAFQIAAKKAREDRADGRIPVFLGAQGMLARMYDKITEYPNSEDREKLLLDIAVSAMFAFSTTIPDVDIGDDEEEIEEESDGIEPETPQEDEGKPDSRWTPVPANTELPTSQRSNKTATEEEEDDEV